ncbi:MAG TPA: hypothetical protein VFG52_04045 [Xanthomonadales bacterium]|nr:hypothetical protein [Xanthomonadales bacterium]
MSEYKHLLYFPDDSKRWPKWFAIFVALTMLALAFPVIADNGQGGRTLVSGDSTYSDCGGLAIELTGDLNGCLEIFPTRYTCDELEGFARYREWGTEEFTDNDGVSTFHTTYDLEGIYTPGFCESFDFSTQLAGGCNHKIFSGRGKFLGSNGSITFNDIIPEPGVSGASNFLYHGNMKLSN